jgi:peptidoglycan/LPS O-acetylase OafA/YrhL
MFGYRREIDGLRALAVIPVILFHAGFEAFSGGFVGVDVFFVISGYLITSIILTQKAAGTFSLMNFYERRARRILPALFVVMAACIPFAWLWMLPDPLENFGQSLVATTLISNNILLFITAGYWDLGADYKPLLHTWSLAVEEQFYLVYPVFLGFALVLPKRYLITLIFALAACSFAISEWAWQEYPTANFYLAPTRAWELLVGSLAAFIVEKRGVRKDNFLSILGLFLIMFAVYVYDRNTPFSSIYTALPVLGTALVILYADRGTYAAKTLGTKLFVGVGLISYSAYLWHQPLLSFFKIYSVTELEDLDKWGLVFATFLLSFVSWKFIETPCRDKSKISRSGIWLSTTVCTLLFCGIGYWFHATNGVPTRLFSEHEFQRSTHEIKATNLQSYIDLRSDLLIMGDSYSGDIAYLLSYEFPKIKFRTKGMGSAEKEIEKILCGEDFIASLSSEGIKKLVFAFDEGYASYCTSKILEKAKESGIDILFIGTKQFGLNLNWLSRIEKKERGNLCQPVADKFRTIDIKDRGSIPAENYVSFVSLINDSKCIPITNDRGELLASDGKHLTIAGVEFYAPVFFENNNVRRLLGR